MEGAYVLVYLGVALASLLIVLASRRRWGGSKDGLRLPPGPWQLPVIGSLHHLFLTGQLPHRALRELARRYGPVMLLRLGEVNAVVVSSREGAREVMKTHDTTFATRPLSATMRVLSSGGRDIIFAPYGDYWRQLRKIAVAELFTARRVMSFRSIREEEVVVATQGNPSYLSLSSLEQGRKKKTQDTRNSGPAHERRRGRTHALIFFSLQCLHGWLQLNTLAHYKEYTGFIGGSAPALPTPSTHRSRSVRARYALGIHDPHDSPAPHDALFYTPGAA